MDAGATDLEEAVQLLSEIWGADFMMNQDSEIRETVQAFSKVGQGGAIDRHEFVKFVSQHPTLLMPVYLFQDAVRCVGLGLQSPHRRCCHGCVVALLRGLVGGWNWRAPGLTCATTRRS